MRPIPVKVLYREEIQPTEEQKERIINEGLYIPKEKQSKWTMEYKIFGPKELIIESTKVKTGILVDFVTKECTTYGIVLFEDGHFEEHFLFNIIHLKSDKKEE